MASISGGTPAASHSSRWFTLCSIAHEPSALIIPQRSAIGMNSSGLMAPNSRLFQRIRLSAPVKVAVAVSTCGWNTRRISSAAIAPRSACSSVARRCASALMPASKK